MDVTMKTFGTKFQNFSEKGSFSQKNFLILRGFTTQRYASALLAVIVCLSVCPSIRLSVRHKSELYKDG